MGDISEVAFSSALKYDIPIQIFKVTRVWA